MPYPDSPFNTNFDSRILFEVSHTSKEKIQIEEDYLGTLLKWLCTSPIVTSFRVNTLKTTVEEIQGLILKQIEESVPDITNIKFPTIEKHSFLPEVILLYNWEDKFVNLQKKNKDVIVDVFCAAAVLRGASIFAPGIIGMISGTNINDPVSIYADISGKCKKGLPRTYSCLLKTFIGNGIVKMSRKELFGENLKPEGIAVKVTDVISKCPIVREDFFPPGSVLLQNIPSVACVRILNPQPGEIILDMCAAPGNKTTHIAALMNNTGVLIALDKTPSKVEILKRKCMEFGAKVHVYQADSTKICNSSINECTLTEPPYSEETFDRILLDAPCSALGKRPQLRNDISIKVLKSYVPLQRKLFQSAVSLLKPNGVLVYSTCTITTAENEGIVTWALKVFPQLELVKAEPHLGGHGLKVQGLTDEQRSCLQRFGPGEEDSVGFFIVRFIKKPVQ